MPSVARRADSHASCSLFLCALYRCLTACNVACLVLVEKLLRLADLRKRRELLLELVDLVVVLAPDRGATCATQYNPLQHRMYNTTL
jgi:hypothetical protein